MSTKHPTVAPPTLKLATVHNLPKPSPSVDHPVEVARRALMVAAEAEGGEWRELMLRCAHALPSRIGARA